MSKKSRSETSAESGEQPLQKFFFPTENRVIYAASLEEATEKLKGKKEEK